MGFMAGRGVKRAAWVGFCPLGVTKIVGIPRAATNRSHRADLGMQSHGENGGPQVWEGSLLRA